MRFLASVRGDRSKAIDLDADKARKRLLRRGHDLNELLRENVVTKFYLDRDLYLESAQEPTPKEIAEAEAEVRDMDYETRKSELKRVVKENPTHTSHFAADPNWCPRCHMFAEGLYSSKSNVVASLSYGGLGDRAGPHHDRRQVDVQDRNPARVLAHQEEVEALVPTVPARNEDPIYGRAQGPATPRTGRRLLGHERLQGR
jgi:hypothetical protein